MSTYSINKVQVSDSQEQENFILIDEYNMEKNGEEKFILVDEWRINEKLQRKEDRVVTHKKDYVSKEDMKKEIKDININKNIQNESDDEVDEENPLEILKETI